VIVCSDHGFYPTTAGVVESPSDLTGPATAWHRPYGIVGVASAGLLANDRADERVDAAASIGFVTPVDMAPTILHVAGLGIPSDMPGRVVREMLPAESREREPQRVTPQPFVRVAVPDAVRSDADDAVARLQALGYVGGSRTSLARQNLGESLLRRGKLEAAERELRAVLEVQPQNLSANLWLAQALARQNRTAAAIAVYERAVALPGGAREALSTAVDLTIGANDLTAAERLISAADRQSRTAILVARGSVAEARGDTKRAETSYRSALDADPLSFDALARLFELLAAAGRAQDALTIVERGAQAAPDSPHHLALVGEARLAARDASGAEKALRRALEMVPDGDAVRVTLARALVAQNRPDDAIRVIAAAAPSADRDVVMGAAYAAKRDYQRVVQYLQSALDRGRATPDVLNGLGYACVQLGRSQDAIRMFERSLAVMSNQPEIRKLLAEIRKSPDEVPGA
jgi:tetratricopeptide (TPR) repeat protein